MPRIYYKRCAFKRCPNHNGNPNVQFHMFPMNKENWQKWLQVVNNPELSNLPHLQLRRYYSVCSNHFRSVQFQTPEQKKLLTGAVPLHYENNAEQPPPSTSKTNVTAEEEGEPKIKMAVCSICLKLFSTQPSLNRHYREVHGQDYEYPIACSSETPLTHRCIETECSDSANNAYRTSNDLRKHLWLFHEMQFETENYVVNNMEDFLAWKAVIEEETNSRYFYKNKCTVSTKEIMYFKCNRSKSRYSIKSDAERKRALKKGGSLKMNISCTSEIRAVKEGDQITVEWVKTHYGHDTDCPPVKRGKNCKRNIAKAELTEGEDTYSLSLIDSSQVQEVKMQRLTEEMSASADPDFEHTDTVLTMSSVSSPEEHMVSPESQKIHSINTIKKLIAEIGLANFEKLDDSTINEIHCYLLTIANLAEFPNSSVPNLDQSIIKQELVEELSQQAGYELAETSFDTVSNDHKYC